jgi:aspartyl-tRNA(Asn)/glutamyl-tRNA(Gln) amidotransferase subunit C
MPITINELQTIAELAYLNITDETTNSNSILLANEVGAIIDYVQQLSQVDTSHIAPLFHPLQLHQRLRADEASEDDCLAQLAELAPHFEQDVYLVPTVINTDKS